MMNAERQMEVYLKERKLVEFVAFGDKDASLSHTLDS
jgi:hypothetical protein